MMRTFAGFTLIALLSGAGFGQGADKTTADAAPAFLAADVHPSPHTLYSFMRAAPHGDRYIVRQATMVDLIVNAYGVDPSNVTGGPSWLEWDRFEIMAKTPARATAETVKPMLRALLGDRFKLVMHTGTRDEPAFVLSKGKDAPKMTESDGTAAAECRYVDPPPNPPAGSVPFYTFSCHNMTMQAFVQQLRQWAGDYFDHPLVDVTGLKGAYDFDFKFHSKGRAARAGAAGVTVYDAVDKQLGLKLEAKTAPLPVVIVDSVDEKPTPNIADLDKIMPPLPPAEFEVATIRPSPPEEKMGGAVNGGQVNLQAGNMKFMITFAYGISDDMIFNAPKWFDSDRFDLLAKATASAAEPGAPQIEMDDLQVMVRKFLADRFKLQAHMEDRAIDAYTLIATANPKLKKADPTGRTGCKEGPGADGKDPRIATPLLGRLLTCRNMTLTQFADQLQSQANGYIHAPVLDSTGIPGAYDITLSFSSAGQLRTGGGGDAAPAGDTISASDPSGALSLPDAINKQLGLKLEKQKRPVAVLVIDHIEEKPTDN